MSTPLSTKLPGPQAPDELAGLTPLTSTHAKVSKLLLDELLHSGITTDFVETQTDTLNRLRLELGMGNLDTDVTPIDGESTGDYRYLARVWFEQAISFPFRDDIYGVDIKPHVTQAALGYFREHPFRAKSDMTSNACSGYCLAAAMNDPLALSNINPATLDEEIISAGLAINGCQVRHVPIEKLTKEHIKIALTSRTPLTSLKDAPQGMIDEDLAAYAITITGYHLLDLSAEHHGGENIYNAVKSSPRVIFGLKKGDWTDEIIDLALATDPSLLSDIPENLLSKERVQMVAKSDPMVLHDIDSKWLTQDILDTVRTTWVDADLSCLEYLSQPTQESQPVISRSHHHPDAGMGLG